MQEIALAGLYRSGFFDKAAFYGGTALRIFHTQDRFSEDLDFSLLQTEQDFSLEKYQDAIVNEFAALGMNVSISKKQKTKQQNINSAFLIPETLWRELKLETILPQIGVDPKANIKIKIEIDTEPTLNFKIEEKLLLQAFSFYVSVLLFQISLLERCMHYYSVNGVLMYKYDMEWYIKKVIKLDLSHFLTRAKESGDWTEETISEKDFRELLSKKIDTVNME